MCLECSSKSVCTKCLNSKFKPPYCVSDRLSREIFHSTKDTANFIGCDVKCKSCRDSSSKCTECGVGENRSD